MPHDLGLVSFDEPEHAELIDPRITSLDRHDRELGRRAALMLLQALEGDRGAPELVRFPLALRVRRSCGRGG